MTRPQLLEEFLRRLESLYQEETGELACSQKYYTQDFVLWVLDFLNVLK